MRLSEARFASALHGRQSTSSHDQSKPGRADRGESWHEWLVGMLSATNDAGPPTRAGADLHLHDNDRLQQRQPELNDLELQGSALDALQSIPFPDSWDVASYVHRKREQLDLELQVSQLQQSRAVSPIQFNDPTRVAKDENMMNMIKELMTWDLMQANKQRRLQVQGLAGEEAHNQHDLSAINRLVDHLLHEYRHCKDSVDGRLVEEYVNRLFERRQ